MNRRLDTHAAITSLLLLLLGCASPPEVAVVDLWGRWKGVFVASTFGEEDRRWDTFDELVESYQEKFKEVPQAERKKLNTSSEIIETLGKAGFAEIEVHTEEKEFHYRDADEWWSSLWSHGGRGLLERLEDKELENFKREAFQLAQGIEDEAGIPSLIQLLITRAR